ncbi:redoxin domain-containing protein [Flavobacteriaceae bacterium]|nr:redoxin domain-containing protein [Flavobacteriaceae bacterium]
MKNFKLIIPILVLALLGYLVFNVVTKIQFKNAIEKKLETIPNFSFITLDKKVFTNSDLKLNTPTVFIYFNSDCDFCQYEAQSISEHSTYFKNVQLLFVSTEDILTIKNFAISYDLLNQSNISFLQDNTDTFSTRFDANSIPFLLVYNKDQVLVKKHKGQLKPTAIMKLLEN